MVLRVSYFLTISSDVYWYVQVAIYLNRLGDYLFTAARLVVSSDTQGCMSAC
jgi:hypothetical protein